MEKLRQGLNIPGLHSTGTTLNWVCDGPAEGSTRSIFKLSPGQKPAPPVSFKTHPPQRMHGRRPLSWWPRLAERPPKLREWSRLCDGLA